MDSQEFLQSTEKVSNFIVDYLNNVSSKKVLPRVSPGFLLNTAEEECPRLGIAFDQIFREFQENILPGVTHWASPHHHAYFPAGNCYPSMTGELLIAGLNNVGINWETSPAIAELETVVMNWLAKMMNLPKEFLNSSNGTGRGVLQNTSTESSLLSLLSARSKTLQKWRNIHSELTDQELVSKFVIYSSVQSHSSVERLGLITMLPTRLLPCDHEGKLSGATLKAAIVEDLSNGFIPFFMVATMGATSTCSWDNLDELGSVCQEYDIWMHIDAAYAGAALVCPELRYISKGLHYANSFAVGLHKWFMMSVDVVAYWLKDSEYLADALSVDRLYLKHKHSGRSVDFSNLQLGAGRKFKALKIWMVLKNYGIAGVQEHIRRHVKLAKYMEQLIRTDNRFSIVASGFGLVVFALKSGNFQTELLRTRINDEGKITLTPSHFNDRYVIRFSINSSTRLHDVDFAWNLISKTANDIEEFAQTSKENVYTKLIQIQNVSDVHI